MGKKVFVGMSGGVDSSVAALLLVEQGYQVTGVYMKNWSRDLPGMKCPWAEDLADAKRVAVKLGINFEVWDFEEAYREKVVQHMLDEFKRGRTPNPDVMCNQEIKFKLFYEKARERGAEFIATGHYARVRREGIPFVSRHASSRPSLRGSSLTCSPSVAQYLEPKVSPSLLTSVDQNKDQTYFLYRISEEALAHTLFPVGGMLKPEVKKLAEERGLHNAYKKESMGVCFVGEVGMKDFLQEYIETKPGEIIEIESGKVLGYHEGAVFYTIGQRHGLYLSGLKGEVNNGMPYYVVAKDLEKNIVYVSKNLNDERIWTKELKLSDVVWREENISGMEEGETYKVKSAKKIDKIDIGNENREEVQENRSIKEDESRGYRRGKNGKKVLVRLRHRAELVPAVFDGEKVVFEEAVKRPASGQSAVLYDGEVCLGGGIIE